jgi:hypothetical protein
MTPGEVVYEGELLKLGKKTDMWVKRYFVLKDNALIQYTDSACNVLVSKIPSLSLTFSRCNIPTWLVCGNFLSQRSTWIQDLP